MDAFDGSRVKVAPGTLYIAPLGTAEPSSISGAWPAGWSQLGYTDTGSQFDFTPQTDTITVEEEYFPVRYVTTGMTASLTFAMAEQTANNLLIALNAGTSADRAADTTGGSPDITDGSWVEPPAINTEKRVMLGWDALNSAGSAGGADAFARLVARQCFQTGTVSLLARKGNNKRLYTCTFARAQTGGTSRSPPNSTGSAPASSTATTCCKANASRPPCSSPPISSGPWVGWRRPA